ncbi:MAG: Xaa-Pro aminopeptidase [Betaproteobacteria bacterium CG2_30_59_46]|nr:MAG: Xaa-Pro aminopeptidase [Betaproteobacteria bacterium CG2_30_59_46]PIQ13608.1 MAG: Xaa-Pro aminopeptidase [Hydrogenophilales bacterium CG18_big_fil_WC_8_21_14_2_50_58_12]PIY01707.1 MAG: Xaa-Pro aminopeptidase [Hydrogenophilales bacterium CG_4_10_14_3_um_filter_58_23]PJB08489.1 MAG: Xaa-Pro aminopeptidase [Hydrogenophilales bacterium CG_4_9_14_3_um_filter_59_35]
MIELSTYQQRRLRLAEQMQGGVAVIPTAPERPRNRDSVYPYRFDSYFHYLTGFGEPEAALVLVAGAAPKSILFCREKNPEREVWDGFRYGPAAAREEFGFDEAYPITELDAMMPKLLADQPSLYFHLGADSDWDARAVGWLNAVRAEVRNGIAAPSAIRDVRVLLDEMRLIKSTEEIAALRRAAEISTAAHRRAMQQVRPGRHEYEIEAELLHEFRRMGAQAPAYSSIVAGGANACVLHYVDNGAVLRDGDLLLIDAACELDGYAADITRTFPVNGRYSAAQKDVYEIVLAAQAAAINAVKIGASWDDPHQAALKVLAQGMIGLGLCTGSMDGVLESGDYKRFYMHKTGHWLGMDVHDVGDYKRGGQWRKLEAGMVLTVEPGCYIRPGEGVPESLWNIGIRIEDDVLVTAQGCEVLTLAAPKTVAEVEAVMEEAI